MVNEEFGNSRRRRLQDDKMQDRKIKTGGAKVGPRQVGVDMLGGGGHQRWRARGKVIAL
jgi:hypothetical protein